MKRPSWSEFEQKVAALFRLAGYEVDTDTLLDGGQTDTIITYRSGISRTRIIVECKYSDMNKGVSVDDVENFTYRTINLRTLGKVDQGYLITNAHFSRFSKQQAEAHTYISLFNINELYRKIFDFEYYLRTICDKTNSISGAFINPTYKNYVRKSNSKEEPQDVLEYLVEWSSIEDEHLNKICILGDYGAGKTTLVNKYASILAGKFIENSNDNIIPLVFPLHKYSKAFDIKAMITDIMVNDCYISNFRYETFMGLLNLGIFVVIFDGFDEMARNVDKETRYETLQEIGKIASAGSKVILTGRQSYFPSEEELLEVLSTTNNSEDIYEKAKNALNEIVNYSLYELQPFSREQIIEYLSLSIENLDQLEIISNLVSETYELYEIATRPVLLDMIVKTLPDILKFNDKSAIKPAKLYEVYTDRWIMREEEKGSFRRLIRKSDKLSFMESLSMLMYSDDKLSVSSDEILSLIKLEFKIDDVKDVEYYVNDIRTCSFLSRIKNDYRFIHLTFYEYFLAKRALRILGNGEAIGRELPIQVIRFASELLTSENDNVRYNLFTLSEDKPDFVDGKNAFWIIANSGLKLTDKILANSGLTNEFINSYINYLRTRNISDNLSSLITEIIDTSVRNSKSITLNIRDYYFDIDDLKSDLYFIVLSEIYSNYINTYSELVYVVEVNLNEIIKRLMAPSSTNYQSITSFSMNSFTDYDINVEDTVITNETQNLIKSSLSRLPNRQRIILELHYINDMSIADISFKLNQSMQVTQLTLKEAEKNLRDIVEKDAKYIGIV